ncbi:ABC transporter permease [Streptomyces lancefieldiae]|uniref:ABC-2 family transporter protein n=1 Tax=Streptomyces lancefieldiae TaxID=3075520 RepID=A0ABU3AMY1_9ACTN|nr:ABC-2 family transporter protein [Streptomyces sp. DSM 40712]MDT0610231.1 ABC-2 family transporter protein [Streptomyces sp. DSM 40712]
MAERLADWKQSLDVALFATRMNFRSHLVHPGEVVLANLGALVQAVSGAAVFMLALSTTGVVHGWTLAQWAVLTGFTTVARALWNTVFFGTLDIPDMVRSGELDHYLVRPANPLMLILFSKVDTDVWVEIVIGLGMMGVALQASGAEVGAAVLLFIPVALVGSALVFAAMHLAVTSLSFWLRYDAMLSMLVWRFDSFAQLPMSFYPKWVVAVFSTVVPFAFVGYYPCLYILGKTDSPFVWAFPLAGPLLLIPAVLLWRRGIARYSSTGS